MKSLRYQKTQTYKTKHNKIPKKKTRYKKNSRYQKTQDHKTKIPKTKTSNAQDLKRLKISKKPKITKKQIYIQPEKQYIKNTKRSNSSRYHHKPNLCKTNSSYQNTQDITKTQDIKNSRNQKKKNITTTKTIYQQKQGIKQSKISNNARRQKPR